MNAEQALARLADATGKLSTTRQEHERIVLAINTLSEELKRLSAEKEKPVS